MVKLRISGKGPTASGYRVFLDDKEVSDVLVGVSVDMAIGDVNVATLKFLSDDLEIDVEAETGEGEE